MIIAIGSDHAGYDVKRQCAQFLGELGHRVIDVGTDSAESVDYPDWCLDLYGGRSGAEGC